MVNRIESEASACYTTFGTADELGHLIADDLSLVLTERFDRARGPEVEPEPEQQMRESGTNVPVPRTPLIGREQELQRAVDMLGKRAVALVTFTGPGGCGKSRLALHVAGMLTDAFPDGVFMVELTPITDPTLVPSAIATTLGMRETGTRPVLESLKDYVRNRQLLLLLDNFEQVIEAAPLVSDLLEAGKELAVLVTSRRPLRLREEHELPIPTLELPSPSEAGDPDRVMLSPATQLLIQRAQAVRSDFEVTRENASTLAEICSRVDGLPLAIELAAARFKILTPKNLLARLERRLPLLTSTYRGLPERQRTMRSAVAWSYDLLDPIEQKLFRALSVFAGGCTLEAGQSVCSASGLDCDVLDGLASLVDNALVQQKEMGNEARFWMLQTVAEYGRERLLDGSEEALVLKAHADYFLQLAQEAERESKGPRHAESLEWLEREHDNLREAVTWALESQNVDLALSFGESLWLFWALRHPNEGVGWLKRMVEAGKSDGADPKLRALIFNALGTMMNFQGRYEEALVNLTEAWQLFEQLGDEEGISRTRGNLGWTARDQGDLEKAIPLFDESLAMRRRLDDKWLLARAVASRGVAARDQKDYVLAQDLFEEALALRREIRDVWGTADSLMDLAQLMQSTGQTNRAKVLYAQSLAEFGAMEDKWGTSFSLRGLAEALADANKMGAAARLLAAAEALRTSVGIPFVPVEQEQHHHFLNHVRESLGGDAWKAAWEEGQAMTMAQAVRYGLEASHL